MPPIRSLWSKLVFNSNKNNRKPTYTWKLNNILLNDTLDKEETKKEIKEFLEFNEIKAQYTQIYGTQWN